MTSFDGNFLVFVAKKRNRMLVDGADYCVAFLAKNEGGTAYTCKYALSKGVELINLYDEMEED